MQQEIFSWTFYLKKKSTKQPKNHLISWSLPLCLFSLPIFPVFWVFLGHDTQQLSLYLQLLSLSTSTSVCCIHSRCVGGIKCPELLLAPGERPQGASSCRSYPKCHSTREAILLTFTNPWGAGGAGTGSSSTSICSIRKHQFSFYRKAGYPGAEEMFPLPGRMFAVSPARGMYRNLPRRLSPCGDCSKYLPANSLNRHCCPQSRLEPAPGKQRQI